MTVKKALQLTDWLIQNNTTLRKGLLDSEMPWNKDDLLKKLSVALVGMIDRDSKVLRSIISELVGWFFFFQILTHFVPSFCLKD